jgi:uncharacterized protein (DUF433 family)
MTIAELESKIAALSKAEKSELLQRLVQEVGDEWPGIEKTLDIVGGDARIRNTRIPVWVLEGYRRLGWSEAQILDSYPTLRALDLVYAWAYVDAHQEEIDRAITENETL